MISTMVGERVRRYIGVLGLIAAATLAASPASAIIREGPTSCSSGYHLDCHYNSSHTRYVCSCLRNPPTPVKGTIVPNFYITHVLYAPPGDGSEVTYKTGSVLGSTTTTSDGWNADVKVTAKASGGILGNGGSVAISAGKSWGSTSEDSADVTVTTQSGFAKPGLENFVDHVNYDYIDHGNDEIWFIVKPRIDVTITPAQGASQKRVDWGFAPNQNVVQYFVYLHEITDSSTMNPSVKRYLDSVGITEDYYWDLMTADPFYWGSYPNTWVDPDRFDLVGTFPYMPPPRATDKPTKQTFNLMRTVTNTSTNMSTSSYSAGITVEGSAEFSGLFKATATASAAMTFTHKTSAKNTVGSNVAQGFTLSQPKFGYQGPTLVRVYLDKIWKTFFFNVDYY